MLLIGRGGNSLDHLSESELNLLAASRSSAPSLLRSQLEQQQELLFSQLRSSQQNDMLPPLFADSTRYRSTSAFETRGSGAPFHQHHLSGNCSSTSRLPLLSSTDMGADMHQQHGRSIASLHSSSLSNQQHQRLAAYPQGSEGPAILEALGVVLNVSRQYDEAVQCLRLATYIRQDDYG